MKWKSTLVLLTLTVGVGAYVSLYELKQPTPRERARRARTVAMVRPDTVTRITVTLPAVTATFTRTDDAAWIIEPGRRRANAALLGQLLDALAPLRAERTLTGETGPLDPAAYGLVPPVGQVALTTGEESVAILIGADTPVGHARYVQRGGAPEIYVVSAVLFDEINKPLDDFRDHTLLQTRSWLVHQLAVGGVAAPYTLQRRDTAWRVTAPVEDAADHNTVTGLLRGLESLQIARYVTDAPTDADRRTFGLETPAATIRIAGGEPVTEITLTVGTALPDADELAYVTRSDEPTVYAVPQAPLQALLVDPATLRSRKVFALYTGNVIRAAREGTDPWQVSRTGAGGWQLEATGEPLDGDRVVAWLNTLADLQVMRLVADAPAKLAPYGLEPPGTTLAVWTSVDEDPQQVRLGSATKAGDQVYGWIADRNIVVELPGLARELFATPADRFRPAPPEPPSQE